MKLCKSKGSSFLTNGKHFECPLAYHTLNLADAPPYRTPFLKSRARKTEGQERPLSVQFSTTTVRNGVSIRAIPYSVPYKYGIRTRNYHRPGRSVFCSHKKQTARNGVRLGTASEVHSTSCHTAHSGDSVRYVQQEAEFRLVFCFQNVDKSSECRHLALLKMTSSDTSA